MVPQPMIEQRIATAYPVVRMRIPHVAPDSSLSFPVLCRGGR